MASSISESGTIGRDGKLRLPMDRLRAFFRAHPGESVVVTFQSAESGTSDAQRAYYYGYIVPAVQQALREQGTLMSPVATDVWLRETCPFIEPGEKIDRERFSDFIGWVQQFAAENLSVYIEDAR